MVFRKSFRTRIPKNKNVGSKPGITVTGYNKTPWASPVVDLVAESSYTNYRKTPFTRLLKSKFVPKKMSRLLGKKGRRAKYNPQFVLPPKGFKEIPFKVHQHQSESIHY
jgi:hypothetical protein